MGDDDSCDEGHHAHPGLLRQLVRQLELESELSCSELAWSMERRRGFRRSCSWLSWSEHPPASKVLPIETTLLSSPMSIRVSSACQFSEAVVQAGRLQARLSIQCKVQRVRILGATWAWRTNLVRSFKICAYMRQGLAEQLDHVLQCCDRSFDQRPPHQTS